MKTYLYSIFLTAILLSSCSNENKTVYLKADNIDGLTTKALVTINGFRIGQVDEVNLNSSGEVVIKLELDKEAAISADSKFLIRSLDLPGTKEVTVEPGNSATLIATGDTLAISNSDKELVSDSMPAGLQHIIESLSGAKQRDSILIELRRLNQNIENLKSENLK